MQRTPPKKVEKDRKITYYAKDSIRCPACDGTFKREELFGGRLNVDDMTDELHRLYKPTQAYGEVIPLVYEIDVCPHCYYAAFHADFILGGTKVAGILADKFEDRIKSIQSLFDRVDFQAARSLKEGLASYFLALQCYDFFPKEFSPTIKSAICCLRAAWLCKDMHRKAPTENWDYIALLMYRKARFYYRLALEKEASGKEPYSSVRNLGPDSDKNYGHEGVLYMSAKLELKYGPLDDPEARNKRLNASKFAIARMFGVGKKTKNKPGPLLDKARELYDQLRAELKDAVEDDDE